jgi:hypothetical protein
MKRGHRGGNETVIRIPIQAALEALRRAAKRLFGRRGPEPEDPYALVTVPLRPAPTTSSARDAAEPER